MNRYAAAAACALAVAAASAGAADYAIDPTHTFVSFELPHLGLSTQRVRFDRKEGSVRFDRAARSGSVEITIDMASVNSGVAALDGQLRGKDFFDVDQHPTARFVGRDFAFTGDRVGTVAGSLTMRGRTHPVSLQAVRFDCYPSPLFRREVCGGDFEAVLRRSLWGVGDGLPDAAPDEVRLRVQVEAIRQ